MISHNQIFENKSTDEKTIGWEMLRMENEQKKFSARNNFHLLLGRGKTRIERYLLFFS